MAEWPCRTGEAKSITLWQVIKSSKAERAHVTSVVWGTCYTNPILQFTPTSQCSFLLNPWENLQLVLAIKKKKKSTFFFSFKQPELLCFHVLWQVVFKTPSAFFFKKKRKTCQVVPFVSRPFSYLRWMVQRESQDVWKFSSCEYKHEL